VPFAGDKHPVGALGPCRPHEPLSDRVHPRGLRRGHYHFGPAGGEHRAGRGRELGIPVPDQMSELAPGLSQAGGELAGQLRCPGRGREPGDAQQVHVPRAVLDDERYIEPSAALHSRCGRSPRPGSSQRVRAGKRASGHLGLPGAVSGGSARPLRMVPAPIRCPSRRSSPWIWTTPQQGLSRAS
jgi:hypothetical protein